MNNDKSLPILSIVIPTRNRHEYVESAIRCVLRIPSPRLELVLQDNSDNNKLKSFVDSIHDVRVRYNYIPERLNVIQNFDRAMDMATGEYVCFIGDDDGVNSEILDAVEWAQAQRLDAVLTPWLAKYNWPDVRFRHYGAAFSGTLSIKPFTGRTVFLDNVEAEIRRCVRIAGCEIGDLPRVYYGIVKRECMERLKAKAATYFPGPSPDLANAVAVANYVERMCVVDYPLFLSGTSGGSGTGLSARRRFVGCLEEQAHLPKCYVRNWSNLVPAFFSGQTIWGESVIQALKAVGRGELLRDFNIPLLHARCAVFNPSYLSVTIRSFYRALRATKRSYLLGTLKFFYSYFYTWGLRFKFLISNLLALRLGVGPHTIKEIGNIEDAANALTEYLKTTGKQFDRHV